MASLKQVRPNVSHENVHVLASNLFGLKEIEIVKELDSYEDRNYHIRAIRTMENMDDRDKEDFVFKIMCSKCTYASSFASGKVEFMEALNKKCSQLAIQKSIRTRSGQLNGVVSLPLPDDLVEEMGRAELINSDNEFLTVNHENKLCFTHLVRLSTYIKGNLLSNSKINRTTLLDMGAIAANMQRASENLEICNMNNHGEEIWDLSLLPLCRKLHLPSLKDSHKKSIAITVIEQFETKVVPILDQLPRQCIHGDLNEANILVLPNSTAESFNYGVIDFGDSSYSCRVFDLAILIAYMLLESDIQKIGLSHIEVASTVLQGFINAKGSISTTELNILHILICARLCQSLVIGNYQLTLVDPKNTYLANTSRNGWEVLQNILQLTDKPFLDAWNKILKND